MADNSWDDLLYSLSAKNPSSRLRKVTSYSDVSSMGPAKPSSASVDPNTAIKRRMKKNRLKEQESQGLSNDGYSG